MCVCLYTENKVGKRRREKEEFKTSIYWLNEKRSLTPWRLIVPI